jgi:hypothetical protein
MSWMPWRAIYARPYLLAVRAPHEEHPSKISNLQIWKLAVHVNSGSTVHSGSTVYLIQEFRPKTCVYF